MLEVAMVGCNAERAVAIQGVAPRIGLDLDRSLDAVQALVGRVGTVAAIAVKPRRRREPSARRFPPAQKAGMRMLVESGSAKTRSSSTSLKGSAIFFAVKLSSAMRLASTTGASAVPPRVP